MKVLNNLLVIMFLSGFFYPQAFADESCMERAKAVKAGMIRADVEKLFVPDGGLTVPLKHERFILRDCSVEKDKVVKIDVQFKPAQLDNDTYNNPELFRQWWQKNNVTRPDDVIISILKEPYSDYPAND